MGPDGPEFGPTRKLDYELEVGFVTGRGPELGATIHVDEAEHHIFGLVLVNDWSARDIQAWEYAPLGPFLGKSFATTVSPWVVPLDALAPFRSPAPVQDPEPLPYLRETHRRGLDIDLRVEVHPHGATSPTTTAHVSFLEMYWTMAQQLAHATVNGATVRPGDLFASGTVSEPSKESVGSLLEASWNGTDPVAMVGGQKRTFLEDGDTVRMTGQCTSTDGVRIGFGECAGTIVA
jgi:fumarylacetoacetase